MSRAVKLELDKTTETASSLLKPRQRAAGGQLSKGRVRAIKTLNKRSTIGRARIRSAVQAVYEQAQQKAR